MGRPTQGNQNKKDVTLTLDVEIYSAAKVYAKKRRTSVSSLVDNLLERELEGEKKRKKPTGRERGAQGGDAFYTGSTPGALISVQAKSRLIEEDPSSTPSAILSVHSRK